MLPKIKKPVFCIKASIKRVSPGMSPSLFICCTKLKDNKNAGINGLSRSLFLFIVRKFDRRSEFDHDYANSKEESIIGES